MMTNESAYGRYRIDDRGFHDRQSHVRANGADGAPWAPRERGGYWRQYEKNRKEDAINALGTTSDSGVGKTPSKSTSSTTA